MRDKIRLGVFCSGQGTNGVNILNFVSENSSSLEVVAALTDNPAAPAIARFAALGVEMKVIPFEKAEGKMGHEKKILDYLETKKVEWICLAGYMRILSRNFLNTFYSPTLPGYKVVNIHPSLLPEFPGKDGHERAFAAGVRTSGATLHYVDGGVDTGQVIYQEKFIRLPEDTLEQFKGRGMEVEYRLYKKFLSKLIEGRL